ncbi:MAG: hypothetical protein N2691_01805 [Patescibacteria group bacterium]|nr:hypothetical protein [Patescibacteria group bacterium]
MTTLVHRVRTLFRKHRPPRWLVFAVSFTVLLYITRTVNLEWGLPYPMHPDERNMAVSIMQMECPRLFEPGCMDPDFYAYGQLPLYLAWFLVSALHFISGRTGEAISFDEATMALRIISAAAALGTGWLIWLSLKLLVAKVRLRNPSREEKNTGSGSPSRFLFALGIPVVFSPALIQLAHFGTTESLLMLSYIALGYYSLRLFYRQLQLLRYATITGLITGLSLATKVSALPYVAIPVIAMVLAYRYTPRKKTEQHREWVRKLIRKLLLRVGYIALFAGIAGVVGLLGSPYNWLRFSQFMGSMTFESGVGFGTIKVFYTRSFEYTAPVFFQFGVILPYALGLPVLALGIAGFFLLPWRHRGYTLLRAMFLLYFLSQAFLYAKWTRFIAPVFPILVLFALATLNSFYTTLLRRWPHGRANTLLRIGAVVTLLFVSVPGIAILRIYAEPDPRYTASEWIHKNIPDGSYILAETANVIDIPILPPNTETPFPPRNYTYISFDFYNVDSDPLIRMQLDEHLARADYIFVNSRRVFRNHTCFEPPSLRPKALLSFNQQLPIPIYTPLLDQQERCRRLADKYPRLQEYYARLFTSGEYRLVGEFASFPGIRIGPVRLLELPDENAEETWTVFDHPVIRIYQRVQK